MASSAARFDADSLASRIKITLLNNRGEPMRPRDIARLIPAPEGRGKSKWTVDVGRECSRLAGAGILDRVPGTTMTRGGVLASTYRLARSYVEPTNPPGEAHDTHPDSSQEGNSIPA